MASMSEKPCSGSVPAIVGVTSSSPSMAISTVIGPFHTPLVKSLQVTSFLNIQNLAFFLHASSSVLFATFFHLSCNTNLKTAILIILYPSPRSATMQHVLVLATKSSIHPSSEPYPVTTTRAEPWPKWSSTLDGPG
jgi:hypothetical protein